MYPPYATAGDGQVYLQWDPSNDPYIDIYSINIYDVNGNNVGKTDTNQTEITIYGLTNGESYYLR